MILMSLHNVESFHLKKLYVEVLKTFKDAHYVKVHFIVQEIINVKIGRDIIPIVQKKYLV